MFHLCYYYKRNMSTTQCYSLLISSLCRNMTWWKGLLIKQSSCSIYWNWVKHLTQVHPRLSPSFLPGKTPLYCVLALVGWILNFTCQFYLFALKLEWIHIANIPNTAIKIPVNTGIPVFLTCFFFKPNWTAERRYKSSFDKILMWHIHYCY